jgi:hypothetical protein
VCPQYSPGSAGELILQRGERGLNYPSIDLEAIDKDSSRIKEKRDKHDNEGRIYVFDSVSLITDKRQHKL